MKTNLILKENYVYNPTKDWYQCSVKSDDKIFPIEVIPPRSSRDFPESFTNPTISISKTLRPDVISTFDINKIESKPMILTPIEVQFDAVWKCAFQKKGTAQDFTAYVSLDNSKLNAVINPEGDFFFFSATIQTKTHVVNGFLYYPKGSDMEISVSGRIDYEENVFSVEASSPQYSITLTVSDSEQSKFQTDPVLSGNYLAFYTKSDNQIEANIKLFSFKNNMVLGNAKINRSDYQLLGFVKDSKLSLMRVGPDPMIFVGNVAAQTEVCIDGEWHDKKNSSGNFAFIKEM